jgi:hypothetical protein
MNAILKGAKPIDYLLTALAVAAGVVLSLDNINSTDASVAKQVANHSMAHSLSSHSWLILPVFVVTALPLLARRTNVLAGLALTTVITAGGLGFGWITRCGFELPLAAAFAYAVARYAGSWRNQIIGLVGVVALNLLSLVMDSAVGMGGLNLGLPVAAILYGIGLFVRSRASKTVAPKTVQTPTLVSEPTAV